MHVYVHAPLCDELVASPGQVALGIRKILRVAQARPGLDYLPPVLVQIDEVEAIVTVGDTGFADFLEPVFVFDAHQRLVGGIDLLVGVDVESVMVDPCHRSEEHTSELQSLMRISYAVFCLKKKNNNTMRDTEN